MQRISSAQWLRSSLRRPEAILLVQIPRVSSFLCPALRSLHSTARGSSDQSDKVLRSIIKQEIASFAEFTPRRSYPASDLETPDPYYPADAATPNAATPDAAALDTVALGTAAPAPCPRAETAPPDSAAPKGPAVTDAPAFDAAVPDAAVPETVVTETVVPETVVPDVVGSEAAPLETAAPDAVAPDAAVPDTTVPDTIAPGATHPVRPPQNDVANRQNIRTLPTLCHGCGSFAQTEDFSLPGFYDMSRKVVKQYLGRIEKDEKKSTVRKQLNRALQAVDTDALANMGIDISDILLADSPTAANDDPDIPTKPPQLPLCDRCHNLIHHNTGSPIFHPDVDSLVATMLESPYKKNHIYHIVDAADFPMSALPRMRLLEDLMPLRGRNRRSQRDRYTRGKQVEVSFIITRADLLAPTQDQVSRLLPYLREVLRDGLGRTAKEVRLGNVRPVSARQSWWTREIKEEIWDRGGANWLVGKVNVGKSSFFETIFPKGDREDPTKGEIKVKVLPKPEAANAVEEFKDSDGVTLREAPSEKERDIQDPVSELGLLPPPLPEEIYPPMPTVSALPGTTAQPIRRPFGKGRGEVIDLPGLPRSNLDQYLKPEFHSQLILLKRVRPNETTTVKPGQSLFIGGIIRITPREDGPLMLMVNFTPLEEHVTSNRKVMEDIQTSIVDNPMVEYTGNEKMKNATKHAGTFELNTDITKDRAGPLTRKNAIGLRAEVLPFIVFGTDILIEGVGWVEVVAQVRRKDFERPADMSSFESDFLGPPKFPAVDVYSPEGKFIGSRKCMNGFVHNRPKDWGKTPPRRTRSYKGGEEKRKRKLERREIRNAARVTDW